MSSFAKISIRFAADLKGFSTEMQNAQRKMNSVGKSFQKVGGALSLGVTLPILAIGAAAIKAASDAEETSSKFDTVFRDVSKAAKDSADVLRNSYGLSSNASKQLLSDTGDLLTGFGFSQTAALDLSTEVNKLAVDLASFTNYSGGAEGASAALTKALLGERESVKSLGISILESDVKARVLINTQQGLTFESERQAKAYATLQIAQDQSKNALGDYARTSEGFANQMRLVKSRLEDVSVQFGEIMLPYVTKLASGMGVLLNKFSNLDESTRKIIVVVGLFVAALGPLLVTLGFLMTTVIPGLVTAFGFLSATVIPAVTAAFTALDVVIAANPIGAIVVAVGALVVAFTAAVQTITPLVSKLQTFYNLVASGGNYTSFVAKQLRDQMTEAAKATADATTKLSAFDKLNGIVSKKSNTVNPIAPPAAVENLTPQVGSIGDISGLQSAMEPITTTPLDLAAENMPKYAAIISDAQLQAMDNAMAFNEGFTAIIGNTAANFAQGFGEMIATAAQGGLSIGGVFKLILTTIADLAIQVGQMAIGIGFAVIGIKKALQSLAGPVAIAAGIALVALGAFAKTALSNMATGGGGGSTAVPALANGGIAYGPTMAYVGEYAGAASNPEVIAPLDKLKAMIVDAIPQGGGGSQKLEFVLRNNVLLAATKQAAEANKRKG